MNSDPTFYSGKIKGLSWFLLFVLVGSLLGITVIISLSWFYSYEEILYWYQEKTYDFLRLKEESEAGFTHSRYKLSRVTGIFLWFVCILVFSLLFKYRKIVKTGLISVSKEICLLISTSSGVLLSIPKKEKWALVLLWSMIIGFQIRNYLHFPFFGDDLASYVYFARNGPLITAIFYPIPNNHIFYNLLSSLTAAFTDDPLLSTRLISFISFHLLMLVLFLYLYRTFTNKWIAYLAVAICGFFFASSIYSVMGRGYMLFSLMTLLAGISLLQYVETRRLVMLFVIITSSVLGAYTVPTFLIPFLGLMMSLLVFSFLYQDKKLLQAGILCGVLVGIGVLLLYLPTFLFSGADAILSNKYVSADSRQNFYTYAYPIAVAEVLSLTAGTNTKGWLVFMILGVLSIPLLRRNENKARNWLILSLCIFAAIFLYTLVSRSFMPLRVLTYASFFVYVSYAIVIAYWIERIKPGRRLYPVAVILIPIVGWWQYQHTVYLSYLFPEKIHNITRNFVDRIIYDGKTAYISTELKYFHWYYIYRNEIAEHSIALKTNPLEADLIFLTSEAEQLNNEGYALIKTVKGIEYSPDYYIYERNPAGKVKP